MYMYPLPQIREVKADYKVILQVKFIEVFILRDLLITCANKTCKVLTLELAADLMQA